MSGLTPMDEGYSADFTNIDKEKAVICDREGCPTKTFPPGTDTFYLHSNDPSQGGRRVSESLILAYCNDIDEYLVEADQSAASAQLNREHRHAVHQQVAKAQRGR